MKKFLAGLAIVIAGFLIPGIGWALDAGVNYTVDLDAIGSDGSIVDLNYSTTATADSDGKIVFSFSGIPTRADGYNFFLITIKKEDGTVVRRSLAPVAAAAGTTNLGVSAVTNAQVEMLLAGFAAAGSDDPILMGLGCVVVRSANMTPAEMSKIAVAGATGAKGFADELTFLGVTAAQLTAFKGAIVDRLGQFSSLYKDAVDAATAADAAGKRGKAAGLLMKIFVESATAAGFPEDYIELGMEACGEAFGNADLVGISQEVLLAIDAEMGGAVDRMRAEKVLQKYSGALSTLGGSVDQLAKFNTAAKNMSSAMQTAFQTFEELFTDPTADFTKAEVAAARTARNTAMQTAFDAFITATEATDEEIDDLRTNLSTAFGLDAPSDEFKFYTSNGPVNWPIMMVIPTNWVCNIKKAGGELAYTRDDLAVPAMMNWLDSDDGNGGHPNNHLRHDYGFVDDNHYEADDEQKLPASVAAFLGLREDLEIIEMTKWQEFDDLGGEPKMVQQKTIMENFAARIEKRIKAIGGTTDDATPISTAEKRALVTLFLSPEI